MTAFQFRTRQELEQPTRFFQQQNYRFGVVWKKKMSPHISVALFSSEAKPTDFRRMTLGCDGGRQFAPRIGQRNRRAAVQQQLHKILCGGVMQSTMVGGKEVDVMFDGWWLDVVGGGCVSYESIRWEGNHRLMLTSRPNRTANNNAVSPNGVVCASTCAFFFTNHSYSHKLNFKTGGLGSAWCLP